MEDDQETSKKVIFSYDEPVQNLFNKIKHFDIEYQVAFAAAINGSKRSELFDILLTSMNDPIQKNNVQLIKDRLALACSNIPGYTLNEVEHYKDIFINDLSGLLHSSNIGDYINDKIRELQFRYDRLQMDLKDGIRDGAPYTFLEDRELNQNDSIETLRYKNYLENLVGLFFGAKPNPTKSLSASYKAEISSQVIETKPNFKNDQIELIFEILKPYFLPEDQLELKYILETGNIVMRKLRFNENGNKLTDTFRKLIDHHFITGCDQKVLIEWIIQNFKYTFRKQVKEFTYDTVEKVISRNDYPCKNPLIQIKNWEIQLVPKHSSKKRRQK